MTSRSVSELLAIYGTSRGNKAGARAYLRRVLRGEGKLPSVIRSAALLGAAGFKGTNNQSISTADAKRAWQAVNQENSNDKQ